jgi:hypothetical protein
MRFYQIYEEGLLAISGDSQNLFDLEDHKKPPE